MARIAVEISVVLNNSKAKTSATIEASQQLVQSLRFVQFGELSGAAGDEVCRSMRGSEQLRYVNLVEVSLRCRLCSISIGPFCILHQ